ncbi:hypothetical protein [Fontibacter flavus]|uniref:Uncharacterized protein n=1 Tax=Fontibacter flavus TaxID=654838 RepID=A0ABV6FT62_9BACT
MFLLYERFMSPTPPKKKKSHVIEGGVVEVKDNNIVLLAEKVL